MEYDFGLEALEFIRYYNSYRQADGILTLSAQYQH